MQIYDGNNALNARIEYQNAMAALRSPDSGLNAASVRDALCTQSYLRLEQPLNATTNTFTFPIQINQTGNSNAVRATERRLQLQDAFYGASIMFFIAAAASATDCAFLLHSYPNSVSFASDSATLQVIYNGFLRLLVNGVTVQPAYPMSNFYISPQTQLTGATNSPIDQLNMGERNSLQPNPVLIGSNNNELVMYLPANIATIGTFRYGVIIWQGILAQNVSAMITNN